MCTCPLEQIRPGKGTASQLRGNVWYCEHTNTDLVVSAGDDVDELVHDDGGHAAPVERHYVEVVVAQD